MSDFDQFAAVFERTIEALVDDPRSVELDAKELPGRVNWSFRVDVNDAGKVVGKGGSHIRALQLLGQVAGLSRKQQWTVTNLNPTGIEREGNSPRLPTPVEHDPIEDVRLLGDLFSVLEIAVSVSVEGTPARGYNFNLSPSLQQDASALMTKHPAVYFRNQREQEPISVIVALGTIFRAIGKRQGVGYHLDVA